MKYVGLISGYSKELMNAMHIHQGFDCHAYNMQKALKYAKMCIKSHKEFINNELVVYAIKYANDYADDFLIYYNDNLEYTKADNALKAFKIYKQIKTLSK